MRKKKKKKNYETKLFDVFQLEEWEFPNKPPPGGKIISNNIIDKSKWEIQKEVVFQLADDPPDEAWKLIYSIGTAAYQEYTDMWVEDPVSAVKMWLRTKKVWEIKPKNAKNKPNELDVLKVRLVEAERCMRRLDDNADPDDLIRLAERCTEYLEKYYPNGDE